MAEQKNFIGKYETILDHDPTPEEFEKITGCSWADRFEYVEHIGRTTPHNDWDNIEELYLTRGDKEKAKKYSKIPQCEIEATYFDLSL